MILVKQLFFVYCDVDGCNATNTKHEQITGPLQIPILTVFTAIQQLTACRLNIFI